MTKAEFQKIDAWVRACDINITRCQDVVMRSAALVKRARKLIEGCRQTIRGREELALKSVKWTEEASRASEVLLVASERRIPGLDLRSRDGIRAQAPLRS